MATALDEKENAGVTKITDANETECAEILVDNEGVKRLRVENSINNLKTNLNYVDMNATTGGVARETVIGSTFTRVINQTNVDGGLLLGFSLTLEKLDETDIAKTWYIRLVVDGVEVFGSTGLPVSTVINENLYNFNPDPNKGVPKIFGILVRNLTFTWEAPLNIPLSYDSTVQIYVRKASDSKKFRAGIAVLTKN